MSIITLQDAIKLGQYSGQDFSAVPPNQSWAGGTAAAVGLALWNPTGSGKTLLLYSLQTFVGLGTYFSLFAVTANPNYANSLTPVNNNLGSAATSVALPTYANTNQTTTGTALLNTNVFVGYDYELLTNARSIAIPPNHGVVALFSFSGNSTWNAIPSWLEY